MRRDSWTAYGSAEVETIPSGEHIPVGNALLSLFHFIDYNSLQRDYNKVRDLDRTPPATGEGCSSFKFSNEKSMVVTPVRQKKGQRTTLD